MQNGLTCEYRVSMVGRAPKKQKKRDIPPEINSLPPWTTSHNSLLYPESSGDIVNDPAALFSLGDFAANIDGNLSRSYLDNLGELSLLSPRSDSNNFWFATAQPDANPDIESVSATVTSDPQAAGQGSAPTASHEATTSLMSTNALASSARSLVPDRVAANVLKTYRDKSVVSQHPHAAALMEIVESLEGHLQNPRAPIDRAMLLNRQAILKVRDILGSHEFQRCQSCPPLVATIMDLVVGLYEVVSITIHQPTNAAHSGSTLDSSPFLSTGQSEIPSELAPTAPYAHDVPVFQFGCLEFDPDEREIFRNAMVRRDLVRCIEAIRHCSREIHRRQQLGNQEDKTAVQHGGFRSTRSCTDRVQLQWYQEMEHQAVRLLASVPVRCSHGDGGS